MSKVQEIQQLVKIVDTAYQPVHSRPSTLNLYGETLTYRYNLSSDLYSHYESGNIVVLGIHGVNSLKLASAAVGQFLLPIVNNKEINKLCKKLEMLKKDKRNIYLVAHSLGCWYVASCMNATFPTIMFAPYVPNAYSSKSTRIAKERKFIKIFYEEDIVPGHLASMKGLTNAIILSNKNPIFNVKTIGGHKTDAFTGNIESNIVKTIN